MAFAFLCFEIASGDQTAEPAIGGAVGRIGKHFEAIDRHQPRADNEFYFSFFRFVMSAHHAGKGVAVGDADSGEPKLVGARHHFLRMRSATKEGTISGYSKLGKRAHLHSHANSREKTHANRPCTNQRGAAVSRP